MNNKINKRAFTIVELVIVIAVVAILSAVLIPTFSGLVKKANEASDTQLVRNLNTSLKLDSAINGEHKTMQSTLDAVNESGFDLAKIMNTKATENTILWDSKNDIFCYLKENTEIIYLPESVTGEKLTANDYRLWKIYSKDDLLLVQGTEEKYSAYLSGEGWEETITVDGKGLDVGKSSSIKTLNYNNNTGTAKEVVIRSNGQMTTLNINGISGDNGDTVNHYGFANVVNVDSVGNNECYHEYGTTNTLTAKAGKVVVESIGNVFELKKANNSESGQNAPKFKNNGGNVLKADAGTISTEEINTNVYNINSYEQLCSFRDATNSGKNFEGITVNLNCDIKLNGPWTPISNYWRKNIAGGSYDLANHAFQGTFNGNNHTISGLTNVGISYEELSTGRNNTTPNNDNEYVYGLFATIYGEAKIMNLKLTDVNIIPITSSTQSSTQALLGDCIAACVGCWMGYSQQDDGSASLKNISASGNISGYDDVAGIIGMVRATTDSTLFIENCDFSGNIISERRSAGIISQVGNNIRTLKMTNCDVNGNVECKYDSVSKPASGANYYLNAGLAVCVNFTYTIELSNCSFTGEVKSNYPNNTENKSYDNFVVSQFNANGGTENNLNKIHVSDNGVWTFDNNEGWKKQ